LCLGLGLEVYCLGLGLGLGSYCLGLGLGLGIYCLGHNTDIYLRQVNGVNGGDNVFVRCVSVCLCVRVYVCAQPTGQSDQFKTVKAVDFKN